MKTMRERFDEVCKTLNIKDFLDLDFDTKIKHFIEQETKKAYQDGRESRQEEIDFLRHEAYGEDIINTIKNRV